MKLTLPSKSWVYFTSNSHFLTTTASRYFIHQCLCIFVLFLISMSSEEELNCVKNIVCLQHFFESIHHITTYLWVLNHF